MHEPPPRCTWRRPHASFRKHAAWDERGAERGSRPGRARSIASARGAFSIDPPEVLRILRVLSKGSVRPAPRATWRRFVHPRRGAIRASGRSGSRGVDMKRKKGDGDEEFDVFGEQDVEAIGDDELEDDEEFEEDDLDETSSVT